MKSKFLFFAILITGLLVMNLSVNQVYGQTPQNKTIKQTTVKYTCPDHPDVINDQVGKCPKCGTELVEKKGIKKGVNQQMKDSSMMNQTAPGDMNKDTKDDEKNQMKKETTPPIK